MLLVRRGLILLVSVLVILPILAYNFLNRVENNEIVVYTALLKEEALLGESIFETEHPGINVKLQHLGTGELPRRVLAERENPKADVIWGLAATNLFPLEWKGLLKGYAPKDLGRVNPRFYDSVVPPQWVGFDAWMSAFCVNKKMLDELSLPVPKSWEELSLPIYEGMIVAPNPNTSGTGYLTVSAMLQNYENETLGWEYLDKLNKNVVYYTKNDEISCDLVKAGTYSIAISSGLSSGVLKGLSESDADSIQIIFPSEGSGWEIEASALIDKDEIKPAAKMFLDWAISDSAIDLYANYSAILSVDNKPDLESYPDTQQQQRDSKQSIPDIYPDPIGEQLIDHNFARYAANRDKILKEWTSRYGDKVKKD